ncbi:MAG: hypothetical protein ACREI8_01260 [Myxococcota bacterium]
MVENVAQGNPAEFSLKVLGGERLARLLERAKEQRYYTVPFRMGTPSTRSATSSLRVGRVIGI